MSNTAETNEPSGVTYHCPHCGNTLIVPDDWDWNRAYICDDCKGSFTLIDTPATAAKRAKMKRRVALLAVIVGVATITVFSLCEWTKHDSYHHVYTFCYLSNKPELGTAYRSGSQELKVFQVVPGGVIARLDHDPFSPIRKEEYGLGVKSEKDKNIFIETSTPYADGEHIKDGYYEFVGNYTYTTVQNTTITLRRFKEHKCKEFRF